MRKLFTILIVAAGLGLLTAGGCTDAGDPVYPEAAGYTVEVMVEDYVGWDNLWVNGSLTGNNAREMTPDGLSWGIEVNVGETGGYGYSLYYDDGSKAMVEVGGPYTVVVNEGGAITGDTEVELEGNGTDGFRIVVTCYNPEYDNIKFKGALWNEDWSTVERDGQNDDLTVFFRDVPGGLDAGTYEWGAIHDDGTENGIWLMPPGPNYAVTIGVGGALSGNLDYLIEAPEPETTLTLNCDMNAVTSYTTVHVRGTFNGWAMAPTDLSDPDEDGIWTVDLGVEQNSTVIFKFIYDGSTYESVPPACGADDGYGGYNRSVDIGTDNVTYSTPWADCPSTK